MKNLLLLKKIVNHIPYVVKLFSAIVSFPFLFLREVFKNGYKETISLIPPIKEWGHLRGVPLKEELKMHGITISVLLIAICYLFVSSSVEEMKKKAIAENLNRVYDSCSFIAQDSSELSDGERTYNDYKTSSDKMRYGYIYSRDTIVQMYLKKRIQNEYVPLLIKKGIPQDKIEFLSTYGLVSIQQSVQFDLPADLLLVQAAHESNFGKSKLAKDFNALFGVKIFKKNGVWKTNHSLASGPSEEKYDSREGFSSSYLSFESKWLSIKNQAFFLGGLYKNKAFKCVGLNFNQSAQLLESKGYANDWYEKTSQGYKQVTCASKREAKENGYINMYAENLILRRQYYNTVFFENLKNETLLTFRYNINKVSKETNKWIK